MCIIIDANVASEFMLPQSDDAQPIARWLTVSGGKLAIGGKLTIELSQTRFRRFLLELDRAGAVMRYAPNVVNAEEIVVRNANLCVSNDLHVVALARISRCRLVFTRDELLKRDVKNRDLISHPRGKIYSSKRHARLLNPAPKCLPYRG